MRLEIPVLLLTLACGVAAADDESTPVFRSDVSMGRIDTLVLDRSQRPIDGLRKEDFVLRLDGKPVPIRNLAYEDLPVDVLLLLDVSGSMRVHVERVAYAAHGALAVLGNQDRVGIMIFDTHTRVRLPFRQDLNEVERKLDDVVRTERFLGGTNINGALLDAAAYVERQGRRQARHAIVIVTDDQAARCDQIRVLAALDRADAVLMVLLAPPFMDWSGYPGGPTPRRGQPPVTSPWPGGGVPGLGGPLGGIILPRRRSPAGNPVPGSPQVGYPINISAGSPEIARSSGGDSLGVDDATAVETTFERIRQRYAIYFYLPDGADNGRGMELDLTDAARRKHPDAALQFRQVTLAKDGARPGLITRVPAHPPSGREPAPVTAEASDASPVRTARRAGVSDSIGSPGPLAAQPAIEVPADPEPAPAKTTIRRRGVSDPGSTPRSVIVPAP